MYFYNNVQEMILLQFCPLADSISLWPADSYSADHFGISP